MSDDEAAIRQVVATWMEATRAGDLETVLGLMAEDVVFLVPGRPPLRGREAYAAAARPPHGRSAPRFDGHSEVQEVQVCGDWAFLWSRLTVVTTPPSGGPSLTRTGHTLSVFRRQEDRWVLARDANMLVAVPSDPPAAQA